MWHKVTKIHCRVQLKIYPRHAHETQQHTFKEVDIVYLTHKEAEPHLTAGTITKAEIFAM